MGVVIEAVMVSYNALMRQKEFFIKLFRDTYNEAESNRPLTNASATSVQRLFRGVTLRSIITKQSFKVNEIQRVFRGHLGRSTTRLLCKERLEMRQLSIFHYYCIQIQRTFRGFYSRKYKANQASRSQYRRALLEQSEIVRQTLQKYAEDLATREEVEAEMKKEETFKTLAQNLHHLVSTKQIPGVYKPHPRCNQIPTMKELPVEDHIRGVVKDLLRSRGIVHHGLETDINGAKQIPWKGLKYRLSLQASTPYDILKQEQLKANMTERYVRKNKGNWIAGGTTTVLQKDALPLSVDDPFMDQWANPLIVKGIPTSTKQLLESAWTRKPLFVRHIDQPFYTRADGNKSTTLPNDLFDIMADAHETGGAIQRFKGTATSRFGLSTRTDNRLDGGIIPRPPVRASAVEANNAVKRTMQKMTVKMKTLRETAKLNLKLPLNSPNGSSVASIDVEKLLDPDGAFSSDDDA